MTLDSRQPNQGDLAPGDVYAAVVRRLAEVDHEWGKPYDFTCLYVLDWIVDHAEDPNWRELEEAGAHEPLADDLKAALAKNSQDLPQLRYVRTFLEVFEPDRAGPVQVRDGGAFIALGPVFLDGDSAETGATIYLGWRWSRGLRYSLRKTGDEWRIERSETVWVS